MFPVCFDGLSATLHPAPGRRGAVLIGSPGFEDLCSHRMLVGIGNELATRGIPALRIDLFGTGDSLGVSTDPGLVAHWLSDIAAAVTWMRRELGCVDITLAGFRLGALVATAAARRGDLDVTRLALLAPPPNGKSYLRELKVLSKVIGTGTTAELAGFELAGFHTSEETLKSIQSLDWTGSDALAPTAILACGGAPSVASALEGAGCEVTSLPFEGYDRLMCDPTASAVPAQTVQSVASWLSEGAPLAIRRPIPGHSAVLEGPDWHEEGFCFGVDNKLSGIFCMPRQTQNAPVVLFTNAGGIRRTGWGRMWVEMARELASQGIASVRFDFSYLTPDLSGDAPAFHFGESIWTELTAAADAATARGFGPVIVVGACSGAYHSLRAAVVDSRVEAAVLVNQVCFEWGPEHALPLSAWMMQKAADVDRRRRAADDGLSEIARLRAQLTAQAMNMAKKGVKGALRTLKAVADLLPTAPSKPTDGPDQHFRTLSARGCAIHLVHSEGDSSLNELARHFGPVGARALAIDGVTQTIIPDCDHVLTPRHARRMLLKILRQAAEACRAEPREEARRQA
jgi:pimeloyl-ACP methyl ester carboxylesterase